MPSLLAAAAALTTPAARLRPFDLALIAAYLLGITLFGLRFREKRGGAKADRSLKSYFLADNTIPWWAIALSIVSAETSTLTIISIPGVAFAGDFGFLQLVLGYMLGRVVVAILFLPRYFAGEMLTAYQLIERRFGPVLHKVTAILFLLTRAAAEGVRVFAVSIVVGIAIGTRDVLSIALISALTLLYTFEGGMAAVIWTDVVQMAIYILGTLVALVTLGTHVPGGWHTIGTVASAAGKFHMLNFTLNLTTAYTFWAGVLGGTFLTMASHGTDQLMVQRMLAARNLRESRLALLSSGVVIFIQFAFFLLIGAGLYVFYGAANTAGAPFIAGLHPAMNGPSATALGAPHLASEMWARHSSVTGLTPDRIFPTFIVHEMPTGIAGLLVAAILAAAMSNLSAALNSLSSTTVVDLYLHLRPQAAAPDRARERSLVAKTSTVLWALVLFAIAVYSLAAGGRGHVVEIALSIASVAYGCLLGVFLLGTLTRFATQTGATLGMICGFALNLAIWQFPGRVLYSGWTYTPPASRGWSHPPAIIAIPHIAFTWFVLIGALATFAIGALTSLLFRKQSTGTPTQSTHIRKPSARAAALLLLLLLCLSFPQGICVSAAAQTRGAPKPGAPFMRGTSRLSGPPQTPAPTTTAPDFTPVDTLINTAIAEHKLPGAVVLIGHNGRVVYEHAYGNRKLAGEPGLDGQPSPAEPMTEDTIFDMASLTKCLATATAIMQLYEQGKITSFDDPIAKYLPAFNPQHDETRAKVTLRELLTHTSGEAPDVDLKDAWGLAAPDKAEGIHRALTTPLQSAPGSVMRYSDINFILLGYLVEQLSGEPLERYARTHIFAELGMHGTGYLPIEKPCGSEATVPYPSRKFFKGTRVNQDGNSQIRICRDDDQEWNTDAVLQTAPTAHDDEGTAATNPDFNHLLRGTVHDPTTRRMGGVAGHAGVFSTAHDAGLFAQALLDKLLHNTGPFPLKQSTLQLMTTPEQPGPATPPLGANPPGAPHLAPETRASTEPGAPFIAGPHPAMSGRAATELAAANAAQAAAIRAGDKPAAPGLAPHYPAIKDQNLRGFGWDIDTAYSKPRGAIFPIGSFGHTGFTGTSLWLDPASDTFVILLANAIHPHAGAPISNLRGEVATAAAQALGAFALDSPIPSEQTLSHKENSLASTGPLPDCGDLSGKPRNDEEAKAAAACPGPPASSCVFVRTCRSDEPLGTTVAASNALLERLPPVLTGIDTLEQTHFAALTHLHRLGLFTNAASLDAHARRTVDIFARDLPAAHLTTLFSPEHGLALAHDSEAIGPEADPSGLPVITLYGAHKSDRTPTHAQLADLDAVVIDLQDVGVRFWTFEAATSYFLEAAARERTEFHHPLQIILLDRPNPLGGLAVQGPLSEPGLESYNDTLPLPVRHGLTLGELARFYVAEHHLPADLTVVPLSGWHRSMFLDDAGLPWSSPSPNLRSLTAAILYPGIGLIEQTNLSVGRGTATPFANFGAATPSATPTDPHPTPWFHAADVLAALDARHIPGIAFSPTSMTVAEDSNHYPFHGQTFDAIHLTVTDRTALDSPELGLEILAVLHRLYPTQFRLDRAANLLASPSVLAALTRGDDPRTIDAAAQPARDRFRSATAPYLLYR